MNTSKLPVRVILKVRNAMRRECVDNEKAPQQREAISLSFSNN